MPKKIFIVLLFAVAFPITVHLAVTPSHAFSTYCFPPEEATDGTWTVEFLGIETVEGGCHGNVPGSNEYVEFDECYRWNYKIYNKKKKANGLNRLSILIPDCCSEPYVYIDNEGKESPVRSIPPDLKIFGVAEGERHGFGRNNQTGYVIQRTSASSVDLSIVTNTSAPASVPVELIYRGKRVFSFEIKGPGCTGCASDAAFVPKALIDSVSLGFVENDPAEPVQNCVYCADIDPLSKCVVQLYSCGTGNVPDYCGFVCGDIENPEFCADVEQGKIGQTKIDGKELKWGGGKGKTCPSFTLDTTASPGCKTYYSGGRSFKVCR